MRMKTGNRPLRIDVHSIVWKLFGRVAGCIVLVLAAVLLLNTFALKGYYVRQKKKQVSQAYQTINAACDDPARLSEKLVDLQDNGSVSTLLWDGRRVLYTTQNSDRFRLPSSMRYAPGTYELTVTREDAMMAEDREPAQSILLLGTLNNGWYVYLRTPVAAIEESIAITDRFLLFTGIGALLVGLVLVLVVAKQYADPIRELSRVADRVAQLDFTGRYTGDHRDEIGTLGNSINAMSVALETAITQLKNANARLTADIRQKEERDTARKAFIANVSHELKTPIALIGTYAEGLREDIAGNGENRDYYCGVIEDEAHKISQLLRRMTMLMQLEAGGSPLEIERFDMADLIRNMVSQAHLRASEQKITLETDMPAHVDVFADPYWMENVLENYLSNALHHTPSGGTVTVRVEIRTPERVRVTVHNTGSPIPPEELPRIWESFYKVDKARTRAYGGSGIGLSVVAAIMKAHGMPYGVMNTPDGVSFYFESEIK